MKLSTRWSNFDASSTLAESSVLECGRGRKAGNNASVNALAQRRYHQKLKVQKDMAST